jgi:hypothetical protein
MGYRGYKSSISMDCCFKFSNISFMPKIPHAPTKAESFTVRKEQPPSKNSDRRKLVCACLWRNRCASELVAVGGVGWQSAVGKGALFKLLFHPF